MRTKKKQQAIKSSSSASLSNEIRRLSEHYSTDYVDVLDRPAPGRSLVVKRVHVDEVREPVTQRHN